jgi:hypothetical protein
MEKEKFLKWVDQQLSFTNYMNAERWLLEKIKKDIMEGKYDTTK